METRRQSLFFLTLFLFSLAQGFDHSDDLRRLRSTFHKTWQNAPSGLSLHSRPLSTHEALTDIGSTSFRRLQQLNGGDICEWNGSNPDDGFCSVTAHGLQELLGLAKNPVAAFLRRSLICGSAETQKQCTNLECQWAGQYSCLPTLREFRKFHSADCLKPVDHLNDKLEGRVRCATQLTEGDCNASEECTWISGQCTFDLWMYYYGIKAVGSSPERFFEARRARRTQLFDEIDEAIERSAITAAEDLLTWDARDFKCPPEFEPVVCDFVDAFTSYELHETYCAVKYSEASELAGCRNDRLCQPTDAVDGDLCTAADAVLTTAVQQAALVFAESIPDEEAKRYETLRSTCNHIAEEGTCDQTRNCVWLNTEGVCGVDGAWSSQEIARLVVDTQDPVCGYYRLPVDLECVSVTDPFACWTTSPCFYDEAREVCDVSLRGEIIYALTSSDLSDALVDTLVDACLEATSASTCATVKIPQP